MIVSSRSRSAAISLVGPQLRRLTLLAAASAVDAHSIRRRAACDRRILVKRRRLGRALERLGHEVRCGSTYTRVLTAMSWIVSGATRCNCRSGQRCAKARQHRCTLSRWSEPGRAWLLASRSGAAAIAVGVLLVTDRASGAGTATLTPVADTYVKSDKPAERFGTKSDLKIDTSPVLNVYLRFDVTVPAGETVTRATLRMYPTSSSNVGFTVHGVADTTWPETTTSYSNAPAIGAQVGASGAYASKVYVPVDVTSLVTAQRPGQLRRQGGQLDLRGVQVARVEHRQAAAARRDERRRRRRRGDGRLRARRRRRRQHDLARPRELRHRAEPRPILLPRRRLRDRHRDRVREQLRAALRRARRASPTR